MSPELAAFSGACRQALDAFLATHLPVQGPSPRLLAAGRYALLGGGKRIRPLLVCATAKLGGRSIGEVLPIAAAMEMIHCYSLAHDDLPAMDDDAIRRGQPACHVAFGEANAILAGDALQSAAFELLATEPMPILTATERLQIVAILARASGWLGMAGGQAADLAAENASISLDELNELHLCKTGALIGACIHAGAIAAGSNAVELTGLMTYGNAIGLAFQIVDDILDSSSSEIIGKPQGSDVRANKATYPGLLGLERAWSEAIRCKERALQALSSYGQEAQQLRDLAEYVVRRDA